MTRCSRDSRKQHRGWTGRTAKGKRPKGDGSPSRAEGSTGTGVAGGGDGANSGGGKQNKKNSGYGLPGGSSQDNEWSADEEGQGSESDCLVQKLCLTSQKLCQKCPNLPRYTKEVPVKNMF